MTKEDSNNLIIFENFSVIDIIAVLTEQQDYQKAKTYWATLKSRLKQE